MTVGELIKELENYDEDMEVVARDKADEINLALLDIVEVKENYYLKKTLELVVDIEEEM